MHANGYRVAVAEEQPSPAPTVVARVDGEGSSAGPPEPSLEHRGYAPTWVTVADATSRTAADRPVTARRVLLQLMGVGLVVVGVVAALGVFVARQVAQREAIHEATQTTSLLAQAVVQPALEDALLGPDPADAVARLDQVVQTRVLSATGIRRIKVWSPEGLIVYSDEPRLIGATFELGPEEIEAVQRGTTISEVADLQHAENAFERDLGPLLGVYRPVWTPSGQPLLFEAYYDYPTVSARTGQLWRGLGGLMLASQLLLLALLLPLVWALFERLRRGQQQREALLEHAVDASSQERQRIAGALHDGVVQELVATSYAVAAGAEQAASAGQPQLAERLRTAARTVRASIAGLRSLLVDIYPPNLGRAGLNPVLSDLADTVRSRNVEVWLDLPDASTPVPLDAEGERLVFRVAQECLRNAARHSGARGVDLRLFQEGAIVVLEISDDGVGFDVDTARRAADEGHLGLRVLPDLANQAGATLRVATSPERGTRWRLEVAAR